MSTPSAPPMDSPFVSSTTEEKKENGILPCFNRSFMIKCVLIILIMLVAYQLYNTYCVDNFKQPSIKTGPEMDTNLDIEREVELLNNMQNKNFQ